MVFVDGRNYVEVVLTGGPCSGKSTSLAYLSEELGNRDIRMLSVPEMATTLIMGGLSDLGQIIAEDPHRALLIETQMILMQGAIRQHYRKLAEALAPQKVVIVYDRAEMDCRAYLREEQFRAIMDEHRLTLHDLRDSYDAVIHLVTAALGAEEHYTTANNEARFETVEQARDADRRTLHAWAGHPHLWIVDNERDFQEKLAQVLAAVLHTVGVPHSEEIERKFLIDGPLDMTHPALAHATRIDIEQTYLRTDDRDVELRVRRRAQGDQVTYFLTEKTNTAGVKRHEREQLIAPSEYLRLLHDADPDRQPIRKTRLCFAHSAHRCELDVIDQGARLEPLYLLEIELLSADQTVNLPDFLTVVREVTDEPEFRMSAVAARLSA